MQGLTGRVRGETEAHIIAKGSSRLFAQPGHHLFLAIDPARATLLAGMHPGKYCLMHVLPRTVEHLQDRRPQQARRTSTELLTWQGKKEVGCPVAV